MVKEIKKANKRFYQCEICKFNYNYKKWAKKCQDWCEKHNSCNIEITKYAVQV